MKNPAKKLQLKEHKEQLKEYLKDASGTYSTIGYPPEIVLPSEVTRAESESAFTKLWGSFYKRKRRSAVTKIRACKVELGAKTLQHQFEYLQQHSTAEHILYGFTHKEALDIYEEVLTNNITEYAQ